MDVNQISSKGVSVNPPVLSKSLSLPSIEAVSNNSAISDLGRSLSQFNLNLPNSAVTSDSENVSFSLRFLRQIEQNASLDGYISKDLSKGEASFYYKFSKTELKEGKEYTHQYEVNFKLSFSSSNSISVTKSEKKEDIMDFLRRITKEIFTKLNDDKTNITAIVLDPDDLKDLAQLTDKKITQLIYRLIEMVKMAVEAKKMLKRELGEEDIVYKPKREKVNTTQIEEKKEMSFDYSYSIKEVGTPQPAE